MIWAQKEKLFWLISIPSLTLRSCSVKQKVEDTSPNEIVCSLSLAQWHPNEAPVQDTWDKTPTSAGALMGSWQCVFLPEFAVSKCPLIVELLNQLSEIVPKGGYYNSSTVIIGRDLH